MQNNIKKTLVILPMIFLLCMSFIGIDARADDKVDKQDTTITSSNQSAEDTQNKDAKSSSSASSTTTSGQTTSEKSPFGTNTDQKKDSSTSKGEATTPSETFPEWKNINGKLYYVTKDGIAKDTGWFKEKDKNPDAKNDYEYYLDKNYAATIGWEKIDDAWYYFNEAGIKQTGWKLINYSWYHLNEKGIMETGWIEDQGKKYYLNAEGARVIGKNYIEDNGTFSRIMEFFKPKYIIQMGNIIIPIKME